jgi:hypothetical protein
MKSKGKSDFSINEIFVRNIQQKYLNKETKKRIRNQIEDTKTLNKINEILSMDKRENILGLYIRVEYTIPAELTLEGKPRKESRSNISGWDVVDKRFENLTMSGFKRTMEKISEKKFNLLEDQG